MVHPAALLHGGLAAGHHLEHLGTHRSHCHLPVRMVSQRFKCNLWNLKFPASGRRNWRTLHVFFENIFCPGHMTWWPSWPTMAPSSTSLPSSLSSTSSTEAWEARWWCACKLSSLSMVYSSLPIFHPWSKYFSQWFHGLGHRDESNCTSEPWSEYTGEY